MPDRVPILPVPGAFLKPEGGAVFCVWAPERSSIRLKLEGISDPIALTPVPGGYFTATVADAREGRLYNYLLDDDSKLYADPCSGFQPQGADGPSQLIDHSKFIWGDTEWHGHDPARHILYEMHIGTFTHEGTWRAAADRLEDLSELGITTIEMMPVAGFSGQFGWSYDPVNFYAPSHNYGTPDDLKYFINKAHGLGIAVILDVVYNHSGPDDNYLAHFADAYFSPVHTTDWGRSFNFDGKNSQPVRDFFIRNVEHWIRNYHFDGFRIDSAENIFDDGTPHIVFEMIKAARAAAGERKIFIVIENEQQTTNFLRPDPVTGACADAAWNDDFHHSAHVALTGRREAYFTDYLARPQEFISLARQGYLFQGQRYEWQDKPRGKPAEDLRPWQFVNYLENHDQIANLGTGMRLWQRSHPALYRAMAAVQILLPQTPLLFQGQEFNSPAPFNYFINVPPEKWPVYRKGRFDQMSQFPSTREIESFLTEPGDPETFLNSKLRHAAKDQRIFRLYQDLIRLRRSDEVLAAEDLEFDGAVLDDRAFAIRYWGKAGERLFLVNLGYDLDLAPAAEPLLAPPSQMRGWGAIWTSEHPDYGGYGCPPPDGKGKRPWHLSAFSAVFLKPQPKEE